MTFIGRHSPAVFSEVHLCGWAPSRGPFSMQVFYYQSPFTTRWGPFTPVSPTDLYKYSIQMPYLLFTPYHIM